MHVEDEQLQKDFYTIITEYNGSLEAVDCNVNIVRYDIELTSSCHLRSCRIVHAYIEHEQWQIYFHTIKTKYWANKGFRVICTFVLLLY